MNTNFVNIIKRIIAEQGEAILGDPQRLKGFVKDYAKNESIDDRRAFGRCIEAGAYNALKSAPDPQRRGAVKTALAGQVQAKTGIDAARCAAALDALEAALFSAASPPYKPPPYQPSAAGAKSVSKKTMLFGIAAGAGALVGTVVSEFFRGGLDGTPGEMITAMAIWGAFTSLGISIGLFVVQNFSTRKKPDAARLIRTVLIGLAAGAFAGGFAQFIFNYTQQISPVIKTITNALCWGVMGAGLGLGAAFYVPNYPPKRAALAGAAGGTIGGAIYVLLMATPGLGSLIGVMMLGFAIGWAISFIEEALRQAWLTVIWGPKETAAVSLGEKPVAFGSSKEADIYLPGDMDHPVRAVVQIENGKVVMYDKVSGQRRELQNNSRVDLGGLSFVVNTK